MAKSDKELEEMEKGRDIWQEVLDGIREIQSGSGVCRNIGGFGPAPPGLGAGP